MEPIIFDNLVTLTNLAVFFGLALAGAVLIANELYKRFG